MEWIKCSEQMPTVNMSCFVLAVDMFCRYEQIYAQYHNGLFYKKINENQRTIDIAIVVDYWIEIPKIPEAK